MNFIKIMVIGLIMTFCFWKFPPKLFKKSTVAKPGFVLTFDDDSIAEWYGIRSLLSEYNVKATFMITNADGLSDENIRMLSQLVKEGHEIGIHGWSHRNPLEMLTKHTITDYVKTEFIRMKEYLENYDIPVNSFAYINGIRNKKLDRELSGYFAVIRAVSESQRHSTLRDIKNVDDIYYDGLKSGALHGLCIDSLQKISIEDINIIFDHVTRENEIVTFYGHKPVRNPTGCGWEVRIGFLKEIFNMSRRFGLKSYLLKEVKSA